MMELPFFVLGCIVGFLYGNHQKTKLLLMKDKQQRDWLSLQSKIKTPAERREEFQIINGYRK